MARGPRVRRKKRFFVGCEGESEQGYVALIQRFTDHRSIPVNLVSKVISRAGDPLAIVQRAITLANQGEKGSKPAFSARFLFLDTDLIGQNPDRDAQIPRLVDEHGFVLVWQHCCFEALLLRHIVGHENDNPPNAEVALARLKAIWPQYRKGLPAQDLVKLISIEDVLRAAQNPRNTDLRVFLEALALLPE